MRGKRIFFHFHENYINLLDSLRKCDEINDPILNLIRVGAEE